VTGSCQHSNVHSRDLLIGWGTPRPVAGAGADLQQSTEHFIGRKGLHSRYELGEARSGQQTAACSSGRPIFSTVTPTLWLIPVAAWS